MKKWIIVFAVLAVFGCAKNSLNKVYYGTGEHLNTKEKYAEITFYVERANEGIKAFEEAVSLYLGKPYKYYQMTASFTNIEELVPYEELEDVIEYIEDLTVVYVINADEGTYFLRRREGILGKDPGVDIYNYTLRLKTGETFEDPEGDLKKQRKVIQKMVEEYIMSSDNITGEARNR